MIKLKSLSCKNFLSVGNATQAVNFDRTDLTLVLGENSDLGGEDGGARNGVGKCVSKDTVIKVKNSKTGEIYETTVENLYTMATAQKSNTL